MNRDVLKALIAKTSLAPSVHNIQPARWRIESNEITLFENINACLPAADPTGKDVGISLGAACEGLILAANQIGLSTVFEPITNAQCENNLRPIGKYRFQDGVTSDPLCKFIEKRRSWRGRFLPSTEDDRMAVSALSTIDTTIIINDKKITQFSKLADEASYGFMRNSDFRKELVSWMRFTKRHPDWTRDGLNAEAMQLGAIEAMGAKYILGPLFHVLDRVFLAPKLLAEADKTCTSTALVIFHRPDNESPFESGRHFYRLWLRIEALGFSAAVLAALADDDQVRGVITSSIDIPHDHRIVSTFRVGKRPGNITLQPARYPLEDILV